MLQVSLQDAARTCVNARRYVYIHLVLVYRTRVRDPCKVCIGIHM